MAINLPGKEKILTIFQQVFSSIGGASIANSDQAVPSWMVKLRDSHLLKLILASSVFLIFSLFLVLSSSSKMVHSVGKFKEVSFIAPQLGEYLPSIKIEGKSAISDAEDIVENNIKIVEQVERALPQIDSDIAIPKSFEFLAKFENNKSKKTLLAIKPVISGFRKDALAEVAGLQIGDLLLKVNGEPIESVMGFYILTSEKPTNEVTLEIDRKGKVVVVKLLSNSSQPITSTNIGIAFDIPGGIKYVTQDEVKKLAQQYKEDFLITISPEWQSLFANNLLRMTQQISLDSQLLATATTPAKLPISKLKTGDFLQWHHQKFTSNLNEYYSKKSRLESQIIEQLGEVGDALIGLSAALLAFLCGIFYYGFMRKS